MAYSRYSRTCDWYVFWESSSDEPVKKDDERLAIWHVDHRRECPSFSYSEVVLMLSTSDFSQVPGYTDTDHELLASCLKEFVNDVDTERNAP